MNTIWLFGGWRPLLPGFKLTPPHSVSRRSCHKICLYAVIAILSVLLIICVPFIFHKTNGGNTCPVAEKRPRCPNNNWIMDNRTCYLISKTKETYASSQNICLSYNATLAVLKDNNKKESVIKYTKEEDLWVGLEKDGGIWRWPDFTPLSPEEVENDAPELMCAILHSHYGALDCSSPRRFICMRDAD